MDGQAATAPVSADDLARFLVDNPDSDRADDEQNSAEPDDESTLDEDTGDVENQDDSPDDDSEDESEPENQTSGQKHKFTVKGDGGGDVEVEVSTEELIAGYKRHADYTRKTQELATEREQAVEQVRTEVTTARQHYMQQAQMAQAAVMRLAGIRSPEEMAQLAQQDPAAYVAEQARVSQVQAVLGQIQGQMHQEQMRAQMQQQEEMQKAFSRCWGTLGQKGIDKPKLQRIFETMTSDYGIAQERFANLSDPALVMVMHDAAAYRDLQKKKAEVTKKTEASPRLPQKQGVPRATEVQKRQVTRLRSGKGSRGDLAAFIAQHNL